MRDLLQARMVRKKPAEANIMANIFWGICWYAVIVGHLIGEGRNEVRFFGAALQGLKRANMPAPTPLLWMKDTLCEAICKNGVYYEGTIRNEVDKIQVFVTYILISRTNRTQDKRPFQND